VPAGPGRERVTDTGQARASAGRIRVLRVISRLNVGGPALHTTLLTRRLDPGRYDTRLVTGRVAPDEGSYLDLYQLPPARVSRLPALGREVRLSRDVVALRQLVRLMARARPHIVHTHTAKAGALGRVAALLTRVPVIVHTFHGHVFQGYFGPAWTRVLLAVERALARRTDCLIAVSPAVRRELLALGIGSPERFRVVPLGLDLDVFARADALRGALRAELGIPPEAPLVGIVARLVPIKAHEVFLRAAALVGARLPEARFLLVGDGEGRPALERLAAGPGLADRVRFLGWRRDLDRIYADLDVVVLTSRNEGSPVALIEAMAAGRAVVATGVGGVRDFVADGVTGCVVRPGDAEAVAAGIADLLEHAERRQTLGKAGREHVLPRFGVERLLADIDRLYTELLRARGVGPDAPGAGRAQPGPRA
jgi:glycosyltransferase involved in cell wall biosynthesis